MLTAVHVAFAPLTGVRVASDVVRDLGVRLPDLRRRGDAVTQLPALGLLTLAGMLPPGMSASWHPASAVDADLVNAISESRPRLVAVSATTASAEEAYRLGETLRGEGVACVLGGLHATACPEEAALHFDAVVVGDGESVWPSVLADAERGQLRPRYHRPWSPALPDWPLPRFDLPARQPSRWTLQTQRGCPFACEFCAASRLLGPYREKPVGAVQRELDALRALDATPVIELADDNTFAVREDAADLLDALEASGVRWFTEVDWRIGERPEILARLAAAGCVQVLIGLESQVLRYPGMGAKQADWDRMLRAIDKIQAAGVAVHGCFIVGADGETRASMDRLEAFVLASDLADVQITLETPFPGTGLRRRLERQGRLLAHRGWSYHTLFDVTFQPDVLSVEELERGFHDLLARVHAPEAVARRSRLRREIWRLNPRLRPGTLAT